MANDLYTETFTVSRLGLGCLHFGVYLDKNQARELVHESMEQNILFYDTSPIYGNGLSEAFLGYALRGRRQDAVISTKVGLKPITHPNGQFGVSPQHLTKRYVKVSVESSLRSLGIDRIDLLQLHAFDERTPLSELFQGLEELLAEGKIRYFGISNYEPSQLDNLLENLPQPLTRKFVSCQVHYNILERRAENAFFNKCKSHGVGLIINRALARGVLGGNYFSVTHFPPASRGQKSQRVRDSITQETIDLVSALKSYAASHGRSCAELALSWVLRKAEVRFALIGARDVAQLRNCKNAETWNLSTEQLNELDAVISNFGFQHRVESTPEVFFER